MKNIFSIKSYTDIEQSKKLAELLPLESADMGYLWNGTSFCEYPVSNQTIFKRIENIPCWSLAALFDFMKDKIIFGGNSPEGWFCCYTIQNPTKTLTIYKDSLVDACYEMILKLHELKML